MDRLALVEGPAVLVRKLDKEVRTADQSDRLSVVDHRQRQQIGVARQDPVDLVAQDGAGNRLDLIRQFGNPVRFLQQHHRARSTAVDF